MTGLALGDTRPIGMVHFGLGPIGLAVAREVATRAGLVSVAAIDVAPAAQGRTMDEVLGRLATRGSPVVVGTLADADISEAQVALHCTSSSLRAVRPQLLELIDAGLNVVSTCEELSYPWAVAQDQARELDLRAKERGVSILGTGVNPGFAMDYLPIVLSGVLSKVDSVRVRRVQDAAVRRLPLQAKAGVGLSVAEFKERVRTNQLGHVGLRQSADSLADAFGWQFDDYTESIRAVVADRATASGLREVAAGQVLGLRQVARGTLEKRPVVVLDLTLAVGVRRAYDEIVLDGDVPLKTHIAGGLHGDTATVAVVVNSVERILHASPGLVTMPDLPPPHPRQSASRSTTQVPALTVL